MNARRYAAVPLTLVLSAWIAGCSSSSKSSSPSAVVATTPAATTPAAAATTAPAPASPAATTPAAASDDGVPQYQPSTVTSSENVGGASKTVLTTADSAQKVSAFYQDALASGGWQVKKTTKSGSTVEYKALKGTSAATVTISPAGAGVSVTVKVIP